MPKKNPSTLSDLRKEFFETAEIRWQFFKRSKVYKANPEKYGEQSPVEVLLEAAEKELAGSLERLALEGRAFMLAMELSGGAINFSLNKTKLKIEIDFKALNCGPAVLCQVAEKIIHDQHAICSKAGLLPGKDDLGFVKPPKNWKNILRAGDIQEKNKTLRLKQIGRKIYPKDDTEAGADSLKGKTKKLVDQYEYLIEGGYEKITFP